ncbi:carboxyl-terminal processing protease [Sulfurivirga caldicuralii]|uniref:Carboxyl-terminal processing protease n=1 Tax=Sulfurivirga caldicuralii TaxID=364032 RepID=A0A1N6DPL7_9GAMM|nr:S41 family peptidase [Sulfurivirga caldicuralii]SIN72614.1 carboxyl-terminal processing protease [Sulfurivirga caldicuralii]
MTGQWMKKIGWLVSGAMLGGTLVVAATVTASDKGKSASGLPLQELRTFVEVFNAVERSYVEPVSDDKLLEYAIKGMVSNLDPHSDYLPPESFKEMQEHTTGEFGGLGMEVSMDKDGFVKVVAPIDDTPAQKAGIRAGDLIIKIDDKPVKGMTLTEAVKLMRGKPGTEVTLTIVRKGEDKPLVIKLKRAIIQVKSVKKKLLGEGFGYVRISQFQVRTGSEMVEAIEKLEEKNGAPLKGLVLDLRNNPGGVLTAAVQVSDAFLNKGLIVYTKGRNEDAQMKFEARRGDVMDGRPVVVLVNEGSASASEIVSGALQDHHRALVAGRKTFGKGSVQTLMPLSNGAAIKLTTARYYTPSGRSIQAEGIVPDVVIPRLKVQKVEENDPLEIHEADLKGHLDHKDDKPVKQKKADAERTEVKKLLDKDYELYEALNLLKGMSLVQLQKEE